jgi:hypothetical protein
LVVFTTRKYKNALEKRIASYPDISDSAKNRFTLQSERKLEIFLKKKKTDYEKRAEKEIIKAKKEAEKIEIIRRKKPKVITHNNLLEKLMSLIQLYVKYRDTDEH